MTLKTCLVRVWFGLLCLALIEGANLALAKREKESACSSMKGRECLCRRPRHKEQSLVCLKENCMRKLPTDDIPSSQVNEVISLLVTRQPNITHIGSQELRRLGKIKDIRIFRCQIREVAADAFVGLNYVERLDLHRNNLTAVPLAIRYLRGLKFLNLGGNRISHFEDDAFYSNTKLQRLILSRNQLKALPGLLPKSLMKLSVNRNLMTSLGNLESLTKLKILYAHGNNLTEFPRLPQSVHVVNLCCNLIRGPISLNSLPNLTAVNLNYNPEIGDIALSTFQGSASRSPLGLTTFKAKSAGVRSITSNAFSCLPQLEHIDISQNCIHTYHTLWFAGNRRLRSAFLAGNPWRCSCDIESSLRRIAETFTLRPHEVELNREEKNRHATSEDIPFFSHDFGNVTCTGKDAPPCEDFRLHRSSCIQREEDKRTLTREMKQESTTTAWTTTPEVTTTKSATTTKPDIASTTTKSTTAAKTSATTTKQQTSPRSTTTTKRTTPEITTTAARILTTTTTQEEKATTLHATSTTTTTTTIPVVTSSPTTKRVTTSRSTTTTPETAKDWCLKDGRKCQFPFVYKDEERFECIPYGYRTWCSATYDYNQDDDWDYCKECEP